MGNTVGLGLRTSYDYLKDPNLVRRIQEQLGVKQIVPQHDDTAVGGVPTSCGNTGNGNNLVRNGHGGNLSWLATKVKRRKRLKHPNSSTFSPPSSPESIKFPDIIVETLPMLDIFFLLATELGYEPFYITFMPFFIWNVDTFMTRHVILMWIGSMYLGQASKALFKWKRPSSPPAIRLENNPNLETEYGFPSTHAIVSTTVPFYFAYGAFLRYEASALIRLTYVLLNSALPCSFHYGLDYLLHFSGVALCVSVGSTWVFIHHWLVCCTIFHQ